MIFCPESDCLLFVGSPDVSGFDDMKKYGMYLSDIPIHDSTRELVLVAEQSQAQVS